MTGVGTGDTLQESFVTPKTGEIATTTVDRDRTEVHAVDVNKVNLPLAVNTVEEDVARREVLVKNATVVHTPGHSAKEVEKRFITLNAMLTELVKTTSERAVKGYEIRVSERTSLKNAGNNLGR